MPCKQESSFPVELVYSALELKHSPLYSEGEDWETIGYSTSESSLNFQDFEALPGMLPVKPYHAPRMFSTTLGDFSKISLPRTKYRLAVRDPSTSGSLAAPEHPQPRPQRRGSSGMMAPKLKIRTRP